jgi:hypothetical protein
MGSKKRLFDDDEIKRNSRKNEASQQQYIKRSLLVKAGNAI